MRGEARQPSFTKDSARILQRHSNSSPVPRYKQPVLSESTVRAMPIVERDLTSFTLPPNLFPPKFNSSITHFTLISSPNSTYKDFTWTLTFPLPNTYRILLTAPNRPQSPQDNVILQYQPLPFKLVSLDLKRSNAVFSFPRPTQGELDGGGRTRELHLDWSDHLVLSTWEISPGQTAKTQTPTQLLCDVPVRSYALTEHGIMRHYSIDRNRLHLGLGERAAPLNLTGRSFQMHGTDAALYDAWESDPLYKHTPFLISTPRGGGTTYAIYHPTNSNAQWDVNRLGDVPSTNFMTFTQDYGGLEEWVMVGKGVREVVRTFAEIVGRPRLVGRDWLGYLGQSRCLWLRL